MSVVTVVVTEFAMQEMFDHAAGARSLGAELN
jgi:hypothetical protein